MRRLVHMALLLLLPPATLLAAPAVDTPSTTGLWKIDGDVMGRPIAMMCQLTENERKLSGTCSGAADGFVAHKIAGTVKAQKVQLYFQTSIGAGSITLIVSGTLNEDRSKMEGDLDVEPMAVGGTFEATREAAIGARSDQQSTPAAAEAPTPAETAAPTPLGAQSDVTGTWKIQGDVQGNDVKLTCMLTEAERKLTGTCTDGGENKTPRVLTGEATATDVGWHFDGQYQGQPITVSMKATPAANGTSMNGTMLVEPFEADGTFVGAKQ
jgi:hypothetical protein